MSVWVLSIYQVENNYAIVYAYIVKEVTSVSGKKSAFFPPSSCFKGISGVPRQKYR